ncbi:protein Flattop [Schistocerca nitens]|uniref:protein Flattop n=1 Tax=Schistocerca nitens TaxID=7011 RepID=UPI002118E376|nr:protein Flattop [Schistocerca nitens]
MAMNYRAGQFDGAYNPRRLRNWEVPERWPSKRAAFGRDHHQPRPIANDRGHLLPGVPRGPRGPWGCYRGTWELPRRITRKQGQYCEAALFLWNYSVALCSLRCRLRPHPVVAAEELSVVNPPVRPPPVEPSSWQKRSASSVPVPERSQAAQEAIDRAAEAAPQPQEDQQEAGPVSAANLPPGTSQQQRLPISL